MTKRCYKCTQIKSMDEFGLCRRANDGKQSSCFGCRKAYRELNKEIIAAKQAVYRDKNTQQISVAKKLYREQNAEKVLQQKLLYREKNREALCQKQKIYHKTKSRLARIRVERYGITVDQWVQMYWDQCGACKICLQPETYTDYRTGETRELSIDHCHMTGKVRGLLCGRCNSAMGLLQESVEIVRSMITYLKNTTNI